MTYPARACARDFLRQIEMTLRRLDITTKDFAAVLRALAQLAAERAATIEGKR